MVMPRIEFDTSVYSADELTLMTRQIDSGLKFIYKHMPLSKLNDLRDKLLGVDRFLGGNRKVKGSMFGTHSTSFGLMQLIAMPREMSATTKGGRHELQLFRSGKLPRYLITKINPENSHRLLSADSQGGKVTI